MFRRTLLLLLLAGLAAGTPARSAPSAGDDRANAVGLLALGRLPADLPATAPTTAAGWFKFHREQLRADAALRRETAARALRDAYGVEPAEAALAARAAAPLTYVEHLEELRRELRGDPAAYEQVMQRAYRRVIGRDAYSIEIDYWRTRETLPFVLLVGCIDNWARRNQPGLMATTGTPTIAHHCPHLRTVVLAPALAAEVRAAAALPDDDPARSCNLIAPGANRIETNAGMHFVAAGLAEGELR